MTGWRARLARGNGGDVIRELAWVGAAWLMMACPTPPPTFPVDAGPVRTDAGGTTFTPDACKAALETPAQLRVGEGMLAWHPTTDNQVLEWEPGPQGGHHVWLALRLTGMAQSGTVVTLVLQDLEVPSAPRELVNRRVVFDLRREEGGWCVLYGLRMQLDEDPSVVIEALAGHHLLVRASAEDVYGATASDQRLLVVVPPSDAGP